MFLQRNLINCGFSQSARYVYWGPSDDSFVHYNEHTSTEGIHHAKNRSSMGKDPRNPLLMFIYNFYKVGNLHIG